MTHGHKTKRTCMVLDMNLTGIWTITLKIIDLIVTRVGRVSVVDTTVLVMLLVMGTL